MDIKIILILILGIFQALDTRGYLSAESKDILSILLILSGGLPTAVHILVWIFGHGPKTSPIKENLLKLLTMDFYPAINNYLMLRNKGVYCSELRKGLYYINEDYLTDCIYSDKSGHLSAFDFESMIEDFELPRCGNLTLVYSRSMELTIPKIVKSGFCRFRLKLGCLRVAITVSKSDDTHNYTCTVVKNYENSSQFREEVHNLTEPQANQFIWLMSIREGAELLTDLRYSKLRRTSISHSNSINEIISKIKQGKLKNLYRVRYDCYVEGLESVRFNALRQSLVDVRMLTVRQMELINLYFEAIKLDEGQKYFILKWISKCCPNSYLQGRKVIGSRQKRRATVDLSFMLDKIGFKTKGIFIDKSLKVRPLVHNLLELFKSSKQIDIEDTGKLVFDDTELEISNSKAESELILLEAGVQDTQKPAEEAVTAPTVRPGGKSEVKKGRVSKPSKIDYTVILNKEKSSNQRVYGVLYSKFQSTEELLTTLKNVVQTVPRSRFNNNTGIKYLSDMLNEFSKHISLSEEFDLLRQFINFNEGALEFIKNLECKKHTASSSDPNPIEAQLLEERKKKIEKLKGFSLSNVRSYKEALMKVCYLNEQLVTNKESVDDLKHASKVKQVISKMNFAWAVKSNLQESFRITPVFKSKRTDPALLNILTYKGQAKITEENFQKVVDSHEGKFKLINNRRAKLKNRFARLSSVAVTIQRANGKLKDQGGWHNYFSPLEIKEVTDKHLKIDEKDFKIACEIISEVVVKEQKEGNLDAVNLKGINKVVQKFLSQGTSNYAEPTKKYRDKMKRVHIRIRGSASSFNTMLKEKKPGVDDILFSGVDISKLKYLNLRKSNPKALNDCKAFLAENMKGCNSLNTKLFEKFSQGDSNPPDWYGGKGVKDIIGEIRKELKLTLLKRMEKNRLESRQKAPRKDPVTVLSNAKRVKIDPKGLTYGDLKALDNLAAYKESQDKIKAELRKKEIEQFNIRKSLAINEIDRVERCTGIRMKLPREFLDPLD